MEKTFAKAEELAFTIKEYVNTRIEIVKLNAAEKISGMVANIVARVIATVIFIFFIAFASLGLAIVLNGWIGKAWAGFLIVAFLYLALGILVWKARRRFIQIPVMNELIRELFNEDEEDKMQGTTATEKVVKPTPAGNQTVSNPVNENVLRNTFTDGAN